MMSGVPLKVCYERGYCAPPDNRILVIVGQVRIDQVRASSHILPPGKDVFLVEYMLECH